jgi:hypothetical protein
MGVSKMSSRSSTTLKAVLLDDAEELQAQAG